jgi:hypothetical protein
MTVNEMPVRSANACAAGVNELIMNPITKFIPIKATPSVIPALIASFDFILTNNPISIINAGIKTADPKFNTLCIICCKVSIVFSPPN